jgi:hypothetical protein
VAHNHEIEYLRICDCGSARATSQEASKLILSEKVTMAIRNKNFLFHNISITILKFGKDFLAMLKE